MTTPNYSDAERELRRVEDRESRSNNVFRADGWRIDVRALAQTIEDEILHRAVVTEGKESRSVSIERALRKVFASMESSR